MKTRITSLLIAMIAFTSVSQAQMMARVQAIHNCPDPGAATVDVYIGATLLLNDFAYKEASPYIDAPAGSAFTLSICPPNSTDTTTAIFKKDFTLMAGNAYTVVASGGLAEMGNTAFDLRAYDGKEMATMSGGISANIIHSSYDAPMVDIYEVQIPAGELANDVSFPSATGYVDLPAADFDVQVRTQTGVVAGEFDIDASGIGDSAITILATGYIDPANAVGTEPFGLIGVFPNGTVVSFPTKSITPARLQVIHNCAATDAGTVDVWLNGSVLVDDFEFRTAAGFIDAPAGEFFDVSITGPMASDTAGALHKQTFILESNMKYIVVASGTIGSGNYDPATPFTLEVIADAREASMTSGNVDVIVWHGSTDAPTVDVVETAQGAGTIVDDISYGEAQGYLDLAATSYALEIRDETGATTVAKYFVDLSSFGDAALTVVASGFLNPTNNNNGPAFGLWAAGPAGGDLIELSVITGIEEEKEDILNVNLFPNPAQDIVNITFDAEEAGITNIMVMDIRGQVMISQQLNLNKGANQFDLDVSRLQSGNYFVLMGENDLSSAIQLIKQ